MHKLMIVALPVLVLGGAAPVAAVAAETVPCEDMLAEVRAAIETANLSDADMAKVKDLEGQGLERCKADDDAGADALFAQALAVMGK